MKKRSFWRWMAAFILLLALGLWLTLSGLNDYRRDLRLPGGGQEAVSPAEREKAG